MCIRDSSESYLKFLRFFIVLFNRNLGKNVPEEYRDEIYGISLSCTDVYKRQSTNTTSVCRKRLKELEIVVVIPTYNNGKTLAAVIEEVCRYAGDIIVINDGSTDDTANILKQYPAIRTITHPVNKGKGTALKHGLSQAQKEGFRYAITIDSDGQHFA